MTILLLLLAGHAVCDYPLQGDFLARCKNHRASIAGVPWWHCLLAHALIHAGMVALVTGSAWLGLAELVAHTAIDYAKCDGRIGFNADQALHLACKLTWVAIMVSA